MMIDIIKGKSVEEALRLVEIFLGMIKKEITDENELEELEDAMALQNISNMPARVKMCSSCMAYIERGFKEII